MVVILTSVAPIVHMPSHTSAARTDVHHGTLPRPAEPSASSSTSISGTLSSAEVEQTGYVTSEAYIARTDSARSAMGNLSFDTVHRWVTSSAEVQVADLARLYVVNGSFDDGNPGTNDAPNGTPEYHPFGWGAISKATGSGQTQRASYETSGEKFVTVENQGYPNHPTKPSYEHYAGTYVFWNQTFDNVPFTDQFELNFDYLYLRGPLQSSGGDFLLGNCSVTVLVDGVRVWSRSLLTLDSRGAWFHMGPISVSVPSVGSVSNISVGLVIDESMVLDPEADYDGDGFADGMLNTAYITVELDNVELRSVTPPSFEEVDLQFHVEGLHTTVTGTGGSGSASIDNGSYWTDSPVDFWLTSNVSTYFEYSVRLLVHRFGNSTTTTDIDQEGVTFSASPSSPCRLTFYVYVGYTGDLESRNLQVRTPSDWANFTVYDSFMANVTGLCTIGQGVVEIPDSLLDTLGWWMFRAASPNYVNSVATEMLNEPSGSWFESSVMRVYNVSRAKTVIGTTSPQPLAGSEFTVRWLMPNNSIWHENVTTGSGTDTFNSLEVTFGPTNTCAGEWKVLVAWNNGTEVGVGCANFSLVRTLDIEPVYRLIDTDVNSTISASVRITDAHTGKPVLDSSLTVLGNWNGGSVTFFPNELHNRWTGEFNATIASPGNNTVTVTAVGPFYDSVECSFVIRVLFLGNSLSANVTSLYLPFGATESVEFEFVDVHGQGIEGAHLSFNVSTGPDDGIECTPPSELGGGRYLASFKSSVAGTYALRVVAAKEFYASADLTLLIFVGEIPTTLSAENGSAASITFGETFNLVLSYANESGSGVAGANVTVTEVNPSSGVLYYPTEDLGNGTYRVRLVPYASGVYVVVVSASKANFQKQYYSFTLAVAEAPMFLTSTETAIAVTVGDWHEVHLFVNDSAGVYLPNASLNIVDPPTQLANYSIVDLQNGSYLLGFTFNSTGAYHLAVTAEVQNHARQTITFAVSVLPVPTTLSDRSGSSAVATMVGVPYEIVLLYERTDCSMLIEGATISVYVEKGPAIEWAATCNESGYVLRLVASTTGRRIVTVTASRPLYESGYFMFVFDVSPLPTALTADGLPEILLFNRSESFIVEYYSTTNSSGIGGATIDVSGSGHEWFGWQDLGDGRYNITIRPVGLGRYTVEFVISKMGFVSQKLVISYEVAEIPVAIQMNPIIWHEGSALVISLQVVELGSGQAVTGATVECTILIPESVPVSIVLHEDPPGTYSAAADIPFVDTDSYTLQIRVIKEYYRLQGDTYITSVVLVPDYQQRVLQQMVAASTPLALAVVVGVVAAAATRIRKKRQRERHRVANKMKQRIDDAHNLVGVLVLHRHSGLPIYSYFLKQVMDEAMVSAFVTAIVHFRFEMSSAEDIEGRIVPVSDVMRVVFTRNLICAFVTMAPPSSRHEELFLQFAEMVRLRFDFEMEAPPTEVPGPAVTHFLNDLVEETLDGVLRHTFVIARPDSIDRKFAPLTAAADKFEERRFKIHDVVREMIAMGVSMVDAYILVSEALEGGIIVPEPNRESRSQRDEETDGSASVDE
ncbi:MAG: carboxypeptidase-like regulatory domain-containing protein [Candidatus Thorarchaeota archaeon]